VVQCWGPNECQMTACAQTLCIHFLPCNSCIFGQPKKPLKGSTFIANDMV
jgi:hypothetical protein